MNLWIDTAGLARAASLFGVPPLERMRRTVGRSPRLRQVCLSGPAADALQWPGAQLRADVRPLGQRLREALAASGDGLVVLDGANAVDPRLLDYLLSATAPCLATRGEGAQRAVALRLDGGLVQDIPPQARNLREVADALLAAGRIELLDEQAFPAYVNKLRRSLPYWLYTVDETTRRGLERRLFWDNYKGSTDLLTRWVYPPLVWPLVRLCTRWGIHPNVVTVLSIVLAFVAVPLFARGDFLLGFLCAYGMSVLDSVDGKVARLTLTDSAIGNLLDHGLDQVHPPFWYFAWAWGLGARDPAEPLYQAAVWLILFYVGDRLVLGLARWRLGFALHAATALDARARSLIARRNINMTIMAAAVLAGAGATGFYVITAWQGLTLAWHAARTLWLGYLGPRRAQPES